MTKQCCTTRSTTWRHMAHETKRRPPYLGMGTLSPLSSQARGLGRAGSVQVLDNLWAQWAHPHFRKAGETATMAQVSPCPKVASVAAPTIC